MDQIIEVAEQALTALGLGHCSHSILSLNFNDVTCVKLTISKGLSLGIIGGAVLVKVPQILKIVSSNSVNGISLLSLLLESLAILIGLAYNYRQENPFSTYGEGAFLVLQNLIIMCMIFIYSSAKQPVRGLLNTLVLVAVTAGSFYSLLEADIVGESLLAQLQVGTIFIGIASKLPQIYGNFADKSTGQLSFLTTLLQFAGTLARVFTTLQEVTDTKILAGITSACVLNGIILFQILAYGGGATAQKKKATNKKKKE